MSREPTVAQFGLLASSLRCSRHLVDDVHVLSPALGEERSRELRTDSESLHAGSPGLALGSDWPVVTMDPIQAMLGAGHKTEGLQGARVVSHDESLAASQALYGLHLGGRKRCTF